jgi:hypothetical protein
MEISRISNIQSSMSRKCAGCKKWLAAGQYTCPFCKRGENDLRSDLKETNMGKLRACFKEASYVGDEAALVLLLAPFAAGEALPATICGEVVAWGESEVLLDAVVKRGCNAVDSACLAQLLQKLTAKRERAHVLEVELQSREASLRKRILKGVEEVSALEQEELAQKRSEIGLLRKLAFLEKVLSGVCKVEEGRELSACRDMLISDKKQFAEPEIVTATPASAKETIAETQERVGANEDVAALNKRDLESSQDEIDSWCGDEEVERDTGVVYCDVMISGQSASISGSLCAFLKKIEGSFTSETGEPTSFSMEKFGGAFLCKWQSRPDWKFPMGFTLHHFWCKKLVFLENAVLKLCTRMYLSKPHRRLALALPFQVVIVLLSFCFRFAFFLLSFIL